MNIADTCIEYHIYLIFNLKISQVTVSFGVSWMPRARQSRITRLSCAPCLENLRITWPLLPSNVLADQRSYFGQVKHNSFYSCLQSVILVFKLYACQICNEYSIFSRCQNCVMQNLAGELDPTMFSDFIYHIINNKLCYIYHINKNII